MSNQNQKANEESIENRLNYTQIPLRCPDCQRNNTIKQIGITILIIIGILALGFLAINQTLGFFYKEQLLLSPCGICKEANPTQATCLEGCFSNQQIPEDNPYLNLNNLDLSTT